MVDEEEDGDMVVFVCVGSELATTLETVAKAGVGSGESGP